MYVEAIRKVYFNESALTLEGMAKKAFASNMDFFGFNGCIYFISKPDEYTITSLKVDDFRG